MRSLGNGKAPCCCSSAQGRRAGDAIGNDIHPDYALTAMMGMITEDDGEGAKNGKNRYTTPSSTNGVLTPSHRPSANLKNLPTLEAVTYLQVTAQDGVLALLPLITRRDFKKGSASSLR